jgi:hypothetical protein
VSEHLNLPEADIFRVKARDLELDLLEKRLEELTMGSET